MYVAKVHVMVEEVRKLRNSRTSSGRRLKKMRVYKTKFIF